MFIEVTFFYGILIALVLLAAIAIAVAVSYERIAWKIKKLEREKELLRAKLNEENFELEQELLKTEINSTSKKQLAKFESLSEKIIEKYKDALDDLKNKNPPPKTKITPTTIAPI